MNSASPERRPEETTPLLWPTSNQRDDAAGNNRRPSSPSSPADEHRVVAGEDAVAEASPSSSRYKLLFPATSLATGIATLAFLFAEMVLAEFGRSNFDYGDWQMRDFEGLMFWAGALSIVYLFGNFICIWRTRKPFYSAINATVLGFFAYVVVGVVAQLMSGYAPDYCRYVNRPQPGDDYSDGDYGVNILSRSSGSMEECQKWALKMQVFKQILIYLGAFYGITLTILFFISAYDAFVATKRFLQLLNVNPRFGDGAVAFEVSLRWGSHRRQGTTQLQRSEEVVASE